MKKYHIILHIGSGNSELTVDMYDEGYKSITNIDYNEFIIKQFEEKWKDRKGMVWQVADFQQRLPYEDQKFDVILDKAGIDCLLFNQAENSFETEVHFGSALRHIERVLKVDGFYIIISSYPPKVLETMIYSHGKNF